MFNQLKIAIQRIHPLLTEEEWQFLESVCTLQKIKKGAFFIEAGQLQTNIGFVNTGLLRGFYFDLKGDEITIRFVKENAFATHYTALLNQEPSKYFFQCLESSEIVLLPYEQIQRGYKKYKGLERFGRLIAEETLKYQQKRIEEFQFLNAEQRYEKFIKEYPELFNRISLTHLASFLGMKRPSLSRIRKKMTQK